MTADRAGSEKSASRALSIQTTPLAAPQLITKIPHILPHERVFPIQIGLELFKLSGASLSSDGKVPCLTCTFDPDINVQVLS